MTRSLSVYLDLVRFIAAAAVLLAHLSVKPFSDGPINWYFGAFGDVAVAVFFVLSGYVIAHVVSTRERDWRSYAASRFSRIYSVALIAAAVTLALDALGASLAPDFYSSRQVLWQAPSLRGYAPSMLMVNEWHVFNFGGIAPGSNGPWWSLSFEATYYLLAGLVLFAPVAISLPLAIVISMMAGTTITLLMPLWWGGFGLYALCRALPRRPRLGLLLWCAGGALLAIYPYIAWRLPDLPLQLEFGRGNFHRPVVKDYFAAASFAVSLLGAKMFLTGAGKVPALLERLARWLGGLTFPLYLLHYPMLCFLVAVSPLEKTGIAHALVVAILAFAAVAALTPACERLKRALRSLARAHGLTAPA